MFGHLNVYSESAFFLNIVKHALTGLVLLRRVCAQNNIHKIVSNVSETPSITSFYYARNRGQASIRSSLTLLIVSKSAALIAFLFRGAEGHNSITTSGKDGIKIGRPFPGTAETA